MTNNAPSAPARTDTSGQRTAVVTGAGSGIGAVTVAVLAREGYRVACLDRDGEAAARMAAAHGPDHLALQLDVTDDAAVERAFAEIAARFGRMDGLATCAGIVDRTPFMEATSETFARVYAVNVTGTFLCMREAARHMAPGGRICAVASISGIRGGGFLGTVAYSASKGAVIALAKTAARNLAAQGISVNTVTPGSTLTPMTRAGLEDQATRDRINSMALLNRLANPAEIAEAIGWILSPLASFVNGANLVVDGGLVLQ